MDAPYGAIARGSLVLQLPCRTPAPPPPSAASDAHPAWLPLPCSARLPFPPRPESPAVDYAAVRKAIAKLIEEDDTRGPLFVRLAWHASGTYSKHDKSGGSSGGLIRFTPEAGWGANVGLDKARGLLEGVKAKFPALSYADLFILSGVVAVEEMGGPQVPFRPGRKDHDSGKASPPDGRLPAADQGCPGKTVKHVRDVFYRMGFSDREIVALLGAHSLGSCHADRSGYVNPWTNAPTTFSNEYFRELLENKWTIKKWDGPVQYEDPTGKLMMLPADMGLLFDKEFRKYVELYANDADLFAKDFAAAFAKLTELGTDLGGGKPW